MSRSARRQPDLFDGADPYAFEETEEDRRERIAQLEEELNGLPAPASPAR